MRMESESLLTKPLRSAGASAVAVVFVLLLGGCPVRHVFEATRDGATGDAADAASEATEVADHSDRGAMTDAGGDVDAVPCPFTIQLTSPTAGTHTNGIVMLSVQV